MFEISYTSVRLCVIDAEDRESAKRRFAAYALYDDVAHVHSDIEISFGDDAELSPHEAAPVTGTREEVRAWLALHDDETETFEPSLFEERDRNLDAYLRALRTNDPWRLEGHGYLGRVLSGEPVIAELATFDGRIRYRFEATQFVDYLRDDVAFSIDPAKPNESLRVAHLVDVSGLRDESLRQIASSYESILREVSLTSRFAGTAVPDRAYDIVFDASSWQRYVSHRRQEPDRFHPPADWTPAYPSAPGPATE